MSVKFQSSVLFVKDVTVSRRFYEGLLGQEVEFDFGENVSFAGGFAIHEANHISQIIFGRPAGDVGGPGCENFELYFEADDLDAALAQCSDAGVEFVHPLREQPWGQRVFRLYDPDGHIVEVGEPIPVFVARFLDHGMSVEQAAERTSVPLDVVQQIAGK